MNKNRNQHNNPQHSRIVNAMTPSSWLFWILFQHRKIMNHLLDGTLQKDMILYCDTKEGRWRRPAGGNQKRERTFDRLSGVCLVRLFPLFCNYGNERSGLETQDDGAFLPLSVNVRREGCVELRLEEEEEEEQDEVDGGLLFLRGPSRQSEKTDGVPPPRRWREAGIGQQHHREEAKKKTTQPKQKHRKKEIWMSCITEIFHPNKNNWTLKDKRQTRVTKRRRRCDDTDRHKSRPVTNTQDFSHWMSAKMSLDNGSLFFIFLSSSSKCRLELEKVSWGVSTGRRNSRWWTFENDVDVDDDNNIALVRLPSFTAALHYTVYWKRVEQQKPSQASRATNTRPAGLYRLAN